MSSRRPARLSPKLRELVAADRLGRPPVERLTAAQAEVLARAALGEQEFDEPVSLPRAITALAQGRPEAALPVLARLLAEPEAPRSNRVAAATALGMIATPEAEDLLLDAARERDPRVQQAALVALGWFGGPRAALELAKLQPGDVHARRQLELARALVAHRHGLDGPFLPPGAAGTTRLTRRSALAELSFTVRTPSAAAADLARVRGPMFNIQIGRRAYALRCGRNEWTIFLNDELGSLRAHTRLTERPWIAAVLARWNSDRLIGITQLVVLTRPAGGEAHVDVVRGDGEVVYTGAAWPLGTATAFRISDVERRGGAPVRLEGRLTGRGVELETALAAASRVGTRETGSAAAP